MFLSLNLGKSKREGEKKKRKEKKSGVSEILLSRREDFETEGEIKIEMVEREKEGERRQIR